MSIKFEVGGFYRDRADNLWEVNRIYNVALYPIEATRVHDGATESFTKSGKVYSDGDSLSDLIKVDGAVTSTQLEVGKAYRTRDGQRVDIIAAINHEAYPFVGIIRGTDGAPDWVYMYTESGVYCITAEEELDIVGEWKEPRVCYVSVHETSAGNVYTVAHKEYQSAVKYNNGERIALVKVVEGQEDAE